MNQVLISEVEFLQYHRAVSCVVFDRLITLGARRSCDTGILISVIICGLI